MRGTYALLERIETVGVGNARDGRVDVVDLPLRDAGETAPACVCVCVCACVCSKGERERERKMREREKGRVLAGER